MQWDDARKTLMFGAREGNFPGHLALRSFNVVVVGGGKGTGEKESMGRFVRYDGSPLAVHLAPTHAPKRQ